MEDDAWSESTIGELFSLTPGYAFKSSAFRNAGTPVLKIKNVKAGEIALGDLAYVDHSFVESHANYLVRHGDILITLSGNRIDGSRETWVGKIAEFRKRGEYLLNQRVAILRPKAPGTIDSRYAAYVLGSDEYQYHFIAIATSSGGQANLSSSQVQNTTISLPTLKVQQAIACILGALDDKIELNRRRNETLEGIARALFQSWFVDFDPVKAKAAGRPPAGLSSDFAALFPDRFEDSELGPIPAGWRAGTIKEVVSVFDSKRVPLSGRQRAERQGKYPYYGAASQMDSVDDYLFDGEYALMGEDGSVVNEDGTPVLQYVWGKFWVNNHAHVLQGAGSVSTEHLLLHLRSCNIVPFVTGAVQPKLNQGNMNRIGFLHAPADVNERFAKSIAPLFEQIRTLHDGSRTLAALRDALLPKLISGELRVPNAERIVGKAIA